MRKQLLLVGFFSFIVFVPWLGLKDFYSRGEAREALVASRMRLTQNYVLPEGYNGAVPSKPPVLHWAINGVSYLLGQEVNEFTARLPSALASTFFLVFLCFFFQGRIAYPWLPSAILGTTAEWFRASTTTRVDCLLSIFTATALLLLFRWYECSLKGVPFGAILFLGLASLTKGPVGLVLPAAIFSFFLWREKVPIAKILSALCVVILPASCIASVWYLQALGQGGERFWAKFYYENIARFSGTMDDEPHKHTIFYLYATLFVGLLPWGIPFGCAAWIKRGEIRRSLSAYYNKEPLNRFCLFWALGVILFFSIPSSKRSVYLLPAYPAIAFLLASVVWWAKDYFARYYYWASNVVLGALLILLLVSLAPGVFDTVGAIPVQFSISIAYCALVLALWWGVRVNRVTGYPQLLYLCVSLGVVYLSVQSFFAPAFANAVSYKSFAQATYDVVGEERALYSFADEFYGLSLYLQKPFYSISVKDNEPVPEGYVYLYERQKDALLGRLSSVQGLEEVRVSDRPVANNRDKVLLGRVYKR